MQAFLDAAETRPGDMIAGDTQRASLARLHELVLREATVMTFNDALLLMAGVFALALLLMPLVRKPRAAGIDGFVFIVFTEKTILFQAGGLLLAVIKAKSVATERALP